jgi:hypothetical protein
VIIDSRDTSRPDRFDPGKHAQGLGVGLARPADEVPKDEDADQLSPVGTSALRQTATW